jgi:molybdenum-dependent DNA-binding transcriptional regulator ModE
MKRLPMAGLEVFLAIAREGSLRAAAKSLGLGASAVSHQLKKFAALCSIRHRQSDGCDTIRT